MKHQRPPAKHAAPAKPWTRLPRRLCKILALPLYLGALHCGAAQAQVQSVHLPYGLGGTPAWREHIALGTDAWLQAYETARMVMLLGRCTALDRSAPQGPAPAVVAASTEVSRWMVGDAHKEQPADPLSQATRDLLPVLAKHAFSAQGLASWETFRDSPQGKRGLAVREVRAALQKLTGQLVDVSSGRYWSWPLARLTRLADAHHLRAEVDAAFEALEPGAAARLRGISPVPGETPADEGFLELVARSGPWLSQQLLKQIQPEDQQAYARLVRNPVPQHWADIAQGLDRFVQGPALGALLGHDVAATVPGFCDSVGLPSCQPGSELHAAITTYRSASTAAQRSPVPMEVARRIVHALPASGCP